jgi:hypothetical protein
MIGDLLGSKFKNVKFRLGLISSAAAQIDVCFKNNFAAVAAPFVCLVHQLISILVSWVALA